MSLTSKSIQGMNSRIFRVFQPKLSIFTRHKHPSFSRILHIMFRFCCIVTFKKQPRVVWRKRCQFRSFVLIGVNILDNIIVLNTNKFQELSHDIVPLFDHFFSQISSQTRKSDFAKQKLSFEKRFTFFPHNSPWMFFLLIAFWKNFLTHSKSFCFFQYPTIVQF